MRQRSPPGRVNYRGRVSLVPNPRATFPGVGCGGAHHHRSLLANPMSLGLAQARPFRVTESTPQLGHVDAVSSAVTTCTTGLRTHPTPLARLPDPRSQADAKRPTPNPFEHGERAYAGTSPRPHLVTMDCFDNSHDHRGTEIGIRLPERSHDPGLATCPPVPPSQSSLREHCPPHTGPRPKESPHHEDQDQCVPCRP